MFSRDFKLKFCLRATSCLFSIKLHQSVSRHHEGSYDVEMIPMNASEGHSSGSCQVVYSGCYNKIDIVPLMFR